MIISLHAWILKYSIGRQNEAISQDISRLSWKRWFAHMRGGDLNWFFPLNDYNPTLWVYSLIDAHLVFLHHHLIFHDQLVVLFSFISEWCCRVFVLLRSVFPFRHVVLFNPVLIEPLGRIMLLNAPICCLSYHCISGLQNYTITAASSNAFQWTRCWFSKK